MNKTRKLTAGLALFAIVGCNAGPNKTNIELIQDMMDQPNVKAQDWDQDRPGMGTGFLPPENTVPRGKVPYPYATDPIAAENSLKNPLAGDMSVEVLKLGKEYYEVYCMVCHGGGGAGDGTVAEKMALRPPSLLTDKAKAYNDGRLYHIITAGQGVMGSYAAQITDEKKRWAIVNYVRSLQNKGAQ